MASVLGNGFDSRIFPICVIQNLSKLKRYMHVKKTDNMVSTQRAAITCALNCAVLPRLDNRVFNIIYMALINHNFLYRKLRIFKYRYIFVSFGLHIIFLHVITQL